MTSMGETSNLKLGDEVLYVGCSPYWDGPKLGHQAKVSSLGKSTVTLEFEDRGPWVCSFSHVKLIIKKKD